MKLSIKIILIILLTFLAFLINQNISTHYTLNLGLSFLIALITAETFFEYGLPRLSSFLLIGILLGPYFLNIFDNNLIEKTKFMDTIALSMIAFIAGLEINFKKDLKSFITFSKFTIIQIIALLIFAIPSIWLLFSMSLQQFSFAAPVVLLSIIFNATSPSTTVAIIKETKSSTNYSNLILTSAIIKDILIIIIFTAAFSLFSSGNNQSVTSVMAHEIYSIMAGILISILIIFYLKIININTGSFFLILLIIFGAMASFLHLNSLLMFLFAGIITNNFSDFGHKINDLFETNFELIILVFFFSAGASINIPALKSMALIAIFIFSLRTILLYITGLLAGKLTKTDIKASKYSAAGFLSQAGVSIGFAKMIANNFSWGENFATLLLAVIGINQILGPLAFKYFLNKYESEPKK